MQAAQRISCALALAVMLGAATTLLEAQGKPSTVPVGPPETPVSAPTAPPENPPSDLIDYVCSILPVPYLCD